MASTSIPGASVWAQEMYDHLIAHVEDERETLISYQELAESTSSPAFAFLAQIILDDERRHHALLDKLAETIRSTAELRGEPTPIPDLGRFHTDREEILAQTERFLELEKDDERKLKQISKGMRDMRDTTLWDLIVQLIRIDNEKHQRILEFIRDRAKAKH